LNLIQYKHEVEYAYRLDAAVNRLTVAALGGYENLGGKTALMVSERSVWKWSENVSSNCL